MKYLIRNKNILTAFIALLATGVANAVTSSPSVEKIRFDLNSPISWIIILLVVVMMLAILSFPAVIKVLAYRVKENKEKGLAILFLLSAGTASAEPSFMDASVLQQIDTTGALILLAVMVVIFTFISLFRTVWKMAQLAKTKEQLAIELENQRIGNTPWARLMKKLTDAKPVEAEGDILLDHDYDGIKELDNNLPPWWLYGFYITIIFAFTYLGIYQVFKVWPSQAEEYQIAMKKAEDEKAAFRATNKNVVDETNVTLLTDGASLGVAQKLYMSSCAACHGDKGQGMVGPNLTDEYWLHGGSVSEVFSTIKYGVPSKGMIAWKNSLNGSQMQKLASYIISLQGTNPPGAKAAEGEKYIAPVVEEVETTEETSEEAPVENK